MMASLPPDGSVSIASRIPFSTVSSSEFVAILIAWNVLVAGSMDRLPCRPALLLTTSASCNVVPMGRPWTIARAIRRDLGSSPSSWMMPARFLSPYSFTI